VAEPKQAVGTLLRDWRRRRRFSQLELACEAGVSTKHLSFLETGRSQPSREMVLRLAEQLEVPLRERNALLLAAGYAPVFAERSLQEPALEAARRTVDLVLRGHEPYPAIAVDRHWNLLAANGAVGILLAGVAPALLAPPVNVLRVSLHPDGLAPRIANLAQWRAHLLARLRHQVETSGDEALGALHAELAGYPGCGTAMASCARSEPAPHGAIAVPFELATDDGVLSFLGTTTVFGTPLEITLAELALESFFPADAATAAFLQDAARARAAS
jgi:transcriptional regulator with XRE-family HTH domain